MALSVKEIALTLAFPITSSGKPCPCVLRWLCYNRIKSSGYTGSRPSLKLINSIDYIFI